ncbi:MAG TPA: hypothetical protein VGM74_20300 [Burkholderiaceae bacterium]|jgi:hypothetical protein
METSPPVLHPQFEDSAWKWAFSDTLIRLFPEMNPDAADEVADSEFREHQELGPKLAAHRWLQLKRDVVR